MVVDEWHVCGGDIYNVRAAIHSIITMWDIDK